MSDTAIIQRRAEEELAHRLRNESYRYYTPIGRVEDFIKVFKSNDFFIVLLSAANGVGKTQVACNIIAHLLFPCGNQYFQGGLFDEWPYPRVGRIISDPTTVTDTIVPMLHDTLPQGRYNEKKYEETKVGKRYPYLWETKGGKPQDRWRFTIMTYEQELKEFESATLGWAWFDEPPPKDIFTATAARMRKGGIIFMTETPLGADAAWIYDEIIVNPKSNKKGVGTTAFVTAELEDACERHGERGFLKHKDILRMISVMDPDEIASRAFGKYEHLTGLIFKKFDTRIHVVDPFDINEQDFVVIMMMDTHPRNPTAVTWLAIHRSGRKFVIDELYGNFRTDELVARIREKETSGGWRVVARYLEPAAYIEDQYTGRSTYSDLLGAGLNFEKASKQRATGIKLMKDEFDYIKQGGQWIKSPTLFFFATCSRHIFEVTHWGWENWRGKTAMIKNPKDKPMDKDDHTMENVGRGLLSGVNFSEIPADYYRNQRSGGTVHVPVSDDPY